MTDESKKLTRFRAALRQQTSENADLKQKLSVASTAIDRMKMAGSRLEKMYAMANETSDGLARQLTLLQNEFAKEIEELKAAHAREIEEIKAAYAKEIEEACASKLITPPKLAAEAKATEMVTEAKDTGNEAPAPVQSLIAAASTADAIVVASEPPDGIPLKENPVVVPEAPIPATGAVQEPPVARGWFPFW